MSSPAPDVDGPVEDPPAASTEPPPRTLPLRPIGFGLAAVVMIGVLVGAAMLLFGGDRGDGADHGDPESVATAVVDEINKLDEASVENLDEVICAAQRDEVRAEFQSLLDAFAVLREAADEEGMSLAEINPTFELGEVDTDGETGTFQVRYLTTFDGETSEDRMAGELVLEGDQWKVCGLG